MEGLDAIVIGNTVRHFVRHVLETIHRVADAESSIVCKVVHHGKDYTVNNRDRESRTALGEGEKNTRRQSNKKKSDIEAHKEIHLYIICLDIYDEHRRQPSPASAAAFAFAISSSYSRVRRSNFC